MDREKAFPVWPDGCLPGIWNTAAFSIIMGQPERTRGATS